MIDSSDDDWPPKKRNIVFHSARGNHANGKANQFPFTRVPWASTHLPPSPTKARYTYTYKLPQLLFFFFFQNNMKSKPQKTLSGPHTSKRNATPLRFLLLLLLLPSYLTLTLPYLYTPSPPPNSKIKRKSKKKAKNPFL